MALARTAIPITPSDTATFNAPTGGLVIGSGGTLTVTTLLGQKVQLTVAAGLLPLLVTQIWSTGTSASDITGLIL